MDDTAYKNYIDGKWQDSISGNTFSNINPADKEQLLGYFQQSIAADVKKAIESAGRAFKEWREYPPAERAQILFSALVLLKERKKEIARELTLEEGKTLKESETEVESAIKEMEFQIGEGLRLFGKSAPSGRANVHCYTLKQPLGVVSILSPWNFPVNVPCRKLVPALMSGNTVVFKPASFTPLSGLRLVELFVEAGLPGGVLNFITGSGSAIGDEMVINPLIKAVSFTGSTEIGMRINRLAALDMTKTQLEMGGKNPAVILEDADLELAADQVVFAAYSCSGQWCTSASRVIIIAEVAGDFIEILREKVKKIKVGPGLDPDTSMGPLAGESQLRKVLEYIEAGVKEGARIVWGGKRLEDAPYHKGFFVEPTVFSEVKPEMRIAREEIFGPVLSVIRVKSFEEAIETANNCVYGLASSVYTGDISKALKFVKESEVGLTHVNLPTAYKEVQLPFGGIKLSGFGLPEAGQSGAEFFTENKSVYINYQVVSKTK